LQRGWNYLEGWYPEVLDGVKAIHYTRGGPWFENMRDCGFAKAWVDEKTRLTNKLSIPA